MRTAHHTVGGLVALCESKRCRLAELPLDELRQKCDRIDEDVRSVLGTKNAAAVLVSYGSGGRERVAEQLTKWKERL
jgi:argininosuccinate lyase